MFVMARMLAIFVVLATAMAISLPTAAAEFDEKQKAEIGQIIREYLLTNPEIFRDALMELDRRQRASEAALSGEQISKNAADLFRSKDDFVAGNPDGDVTLVEFFDYNCGYCQRAMPDVKKLIESDPKLRVVFKEFPILGPGSVFAAKASIAAMKQGKFVEFHEALFEFKGAKDESTVMEAAKSIGVDLDRLAKDMESPEIAAILDRNSKLAAQINVTGTPGFIVGTELIPGAVGFKALATKISAVREAGGCAIC